MFVYLLRTFQVIFQVFIYLNLACFVYFYRNKDGSGFVVFFYALSLEYDLKVGTGCGHTVWGTLLFPYLMYCR